MALHGRILDFDAYVLLLEPADGGPIQMIYKSAVVSVTGPPQRRRPPMPGPTETAREARVRAATGIATERRARAVPPTGRDAVLAPNGVATTGLVPRGGGYGGEPRAASPSPVAATAATEVPAPTATIAAPAPEATASAASGAGHGRSVRRDPTRAPRPLRDEARDRTSRATSSVNSTPTPMLVSR